MKVLVADKFPEDGIEHIKSLGCTVTYNPELKEDFLLGELKSNEYEILVVRSTRVTGEMIEASPFLSLIVRAGSGVNTIDVETASKRSVYVANCPGKNAKAVAELAFGLILSIDRRIPDNVFELRKGYWNKKEFSNARGIFGRTLGIIGVGRIGREMIIRARGFGMRIVGWSRSLSEEKARALGIERCSSILEVAELSDVISVHLALTDETRKIINRDFFNRMKPGAYFINTSRAEIVDQEALIEAMNNRGIRVGLDVFEEEPEVKEGRFDSRLKDHPNLYGTHHIGASTEQAQQAVAEETVRIISEYLQTGKVPNCVNLIDKPPARAMLTIHHKNRVGILASVLDVIRDAGINVERMENIIFQGLEGACARIELDDLLKNDSIDQLKNLSPDIYTVTQVTL